MNNRQDTKNAEPHELLYAQDAIDHQREDRIGNIEKQLQHAMTDAPLFAVR